MSENKKYKDRRGRIVAVSSIDNNIATLNNGERVSVERLNDKSFYTPMGSSAGSQTSTPTPTIINESHEFDILSESADEARYRSLLNSNGFSIGSEDDSILHNIGRVTSTQTSSIRMSGDVVESHNQNLKSLGKQIVEEHTPVTAPYTQSELSPEEELMRKYGAQLATPPPVNESIQKLEQIAYGDEQVRQDIPVVKPEVNPVHQMFDKAKKVHTLDVTLKLNEKIPSKEVIKMMEDNFDESAVEYYTKDIYRRLMENPSLIEDQVKIAIEKYLRSRTKKDTK